MEQDEKRRDTAATHHPANKGCRRAIFHPLATARAREGMGVPLQSLSLPCPKLAEHHQLPRCDLGRRPALSSPRPLSDAPIPARRVQGPPGSRAAPRRAAAGAPLRTGRSEHPPGSDPTAARTRPGTPSTARGPLPVHRRRKRRTHGPCARARPRWPRRRRATGRGKAPAPRPPAWHGGPPGQAAGPGGRSRGGWRRMAALTCYAMAPARTARREREGPPRAGAYGRPGRYRQVGAAPRLHGASAGSERPPLVGSHRALSRSKVGRVLEGVSGERIGAASASRSARSLRS